MIAAWSANAGRTIRKARGRRLNSVERSVMWWLGDWWAFGEKKGYGERKRIVDSEDWEGPAYQTCANAASVSRRFEASARAEALPWKVHEALAPIVEYDTKAGRIIDDSAAREMLSRAVAEGWTVREAKAEVARHKNAAAIGAPVASDGTCTVADLWRLVEAGRR